MYIFSTHHRFWNICCSLSLFSLIVSMFSSGSQHVESSVPRSSSQTQLPLHSVRTITVCMVHVVVVLVLSLGALTIKVHQCRFGWALNWSEQICFSSFDLMFDLLHLPPYANLFFIFWFAYDPFFFFPSSCNVRPTRYSLLLQCYEALSAHPFVAAGQGDSLSGTLCRLKVRDIGLYDTCWWYSLCNLEYWSNCT